MPWIYFALLGAVLVVAAVTDLRHQIVPNRLTVPAIALGLLLHGAEGLTRGGWAGLGDELIVAFAATLVGLVPMALLFLAGGLGGGDVKLVGAVGAISGSWQCVLGTVFYGFLLAAVMAVVLMVRHRIVKRTLQRLLGAALSAYGRSKVHLPRDSPKVPFALAVCLGGLLAGAEHLLRLALPWN